MSELPQTTRRFARCRFANSKSSNAPRIHRSSRVPARQRSADGGRGENGGKSAYAAFCEILHARLLSARILLHYILKWNIGAIVMPIINGRYYMNPQYGVALERARMLGDPSLEEDSSWSVPPSEFLGTLDGSTKSETPPSRPQGGVGQLIRDWTKPGACAQDTPDRAHCKLCCSSAGLAHEAACGSSFLLPPPFGEILGASCEDAALAWDVACENACDKNAH